MNKVKSIHAASMILAIGSLALGFGFNRLWAIVIVDIVVGIAWFMFDRRDRRWPSGIMLCGITAQAVLGMVLQIETILMLLAVSAGLAAWDIEHFFNRLKNVHSQETLLELRGKYLRRLLMVNGSGFLFSAAALLVRALLLQYKVHIVFGGAFSVAVLLGLALIMVVTFLRRTA
jgi:hypothetical protein